MPSQPCDGLPGQPPLILSQHSLFSSGRVPELGIKYLDSFVISIDVLLEVLTLALVGDGCLLLLVVNPDLLGLLGLLRLVLIPVSPSTAHDEISAIIILFFEYRPNLKHTLKIQNLGYPLEKGICGYFGC